MRSRKALVRAATAACAIAAALLCVRGTLRADVASAPAWTIANGVSVAVPSGSDVYVAGAFTQLFTPSTVEDQFYDIATGQVRTECARSTDPDQPLFAYPDNQGGLLVPIGFATGFADAGGPFVPAEGTTVLRIAANCTWDRPFAMGTIDPSDSFNVAVNQPARAGGLVVASNSVFDFATGFQRAQTAAFSATSGVRVGFRDRYQQLGGTLVSELGVLGATPTRVIVRVRTGASGPYTLGAIDPVSLNLTESSSELADESLGVRSWVRGTTLYRLRPAPANTLEAYDLTTLQAKSGWTPPVVPAMADLEVAGSRVFLAARVVNGQAVTPPAAVLAASGALDTSWMPPVLTRRIPDPNGIPYVPALTALASDGQRLYYSGDFELVGGLDRDGVAALNVQSAALEGWDTAPWQVTPIEATTTAVLATRPTGANRVTRRYLAAIDRTTGVPTTWNPNDPAATLQHTPTPVSAVAVDATHVYFASATNGQVLRADRTTAAVDQGWRAVVSRSDGTPGVVTSMAVANGLVYLGGTFDAVSGTAFAATPRQWLAAVGIDGRLATWAPVLYGDPGTTWLRTLIAESGTIYLGGDFTAVNGIYLLGYAAVDGVSGAVTQPLMYVQGENSKFYGLASDGTQTFVAGEAFGAPTVGSASVPDAIFTPYAPAPAQVPRSAAFVAGKLYAGLEYDPETGVATTRTTEWKRVSADSQGLVHVRDDGLVEYFPAIPGNPPGAPTLTAISSGNTVSVSWTPNPSGGVASSYTLFAGSAPGVANLAAIPIRGATTFTAAVPTGLYYLTVVARNGYGTSAPSNEVAVQAGCVAPPAAPAALGYTKFGGSVRLAWSAATTATGYFLEAGQAPGVPNLGAIPLGNITSFAATVPLGVYYVRVRAVNGCGVGPASNEVAVMLDGATPLPQAPAGLTALVAGTTVAFQITPAASGGLAAAFQIEAGLAPGGTIAILPTAATTLIVSNAPSGTFYVRARALNPAGASAPTADVAVVIP